MTAARAIDFDHLDRYTAGDGDLIREVLRLFKGQGVTLLDTLSSTDDPKLWKTTAHGIKGAARGIGAWDFAQIAAEAEKVDFADATARYRLVGALSQAFDAVSAEIEAELAKAA